MKLSFNILCHDIEAQKDFYRELLGLGEALESRSPIYRGLRGENFQLGFNAHAAYELLDLQTRVPANVASEAISGFPTLVLDDPLSVEAAEGVAVALGGSVLKPCFTSYYGQRQVVLADPEGHVFRLAALVRP